MAIATHSHAPPVFSTAPERPAISTCLSLVISAIVGLASLLFLPLRTSLAAGGIAFLLTRFISSWGRDPVSYRPFESSIHHEYRYVYPTYRRIVPVYHVTPSLSPQISHSHFSGVAPLPYAFGQSSGARPYVGRGHEVDRSPLPLDRLNRVIRGGGHHQ